MQVGGDEFDSVAVSFGAAVAGRGVAVADAFAESDEVVEGAFIGGRGWKSVEKTVAIDGSGRVGGAVT